jgi:hypothetical protein
MIRIADSIRLGDTLERILGHEKNADQIEVDLSAGVAALHLTSCGLRGTVSALVLPADRPCPTSLHH